MYFKVHALICRGEMPKTAVSSMGMEPMGWFKQQETDQPLEDSPESLGFLGINKGPFPGHVHTRPYSDARKRTRGYIVAPLSNSYG